MSVVMAQTTADTLNQLAGALQQFSTVGAGGLIAGILIFVYVVLRQSGKREERLTQILGGFIGDQIKGVVGAVNTLKSGVEEQNVDSKLMIARLSDYLATQLKMNERAESIRVAERKSTEVTSGEIRGAILETNALLYQHNDHEKRQLVLIENLANRVNEHEKAADQRLMKHEQASTARTEQLRSDMHVMLAQRDAALTVVVKKVDSIVETIGRLAEVVNKLAEFGTAQDTLRELQKVSTTLERLVAALEANNHPIPEEL